MDEDITTVEKIGALWRAGQYRPFTTVLIIALGVGAAVFEAIGLGFLLPIIQFAQNGGAPEGMSGFVSIFIKFYALFGVQFTLETAVAGIAVVMIVRFTASFGVAWGREALRTNYVRHLQTESFVHALNARMDYLDVQGSDEILNVIVTQSRFTGRVINRIIKLFEQSLLSLMYLGIALYLAPVLAFIAAAIFGAITLVTRYVIEPAYDVGERVAGANEDVQEVAQAGTQGIRDVKLFGLKEEVFDDFSDHVDEYASSHIQLRRNQAAIRDLQQLASVITLVVIVYVSLRFMSLSLGELGVFLFAMFRLAPRASRLNDLFYKVEGDLPHLVRTQRFLDEIASMQEDDSSRNTVPDRVDSISFDRVSFSYGEEDVLKDVSFDAERGETIAFVGKSGAGKSTIVSLLTRFYSPDSGQITANGTPIETFDVDEWRNHIGVVRQDPFIFNDTLEYNLTVGKREADRREIEEVCGIAKIDEFLDELPEGLDTELGDDGVRLSGGQRQRVAIARALLDDADILVLDEATSDLDTNLEEEVYEALERVEREYVTLTIAHRLSTVTGADTIYTLKDGEIIEQGTHDELLDRGGPYAELYVTQSS